MVGLRQRIAEATSAGRWGCSTSLPIILARGCIKSSVFVSPVCPVRVRCM